MKSKKEMDAKAAALLSELENGSRHTPTPLPVGQKYAWGINSLPGSIVYRWVDEFARLDVDLGHVLDHAKSTVEVIDNKSGRVIAHIGPTPAVVEWLLGPQAIAKAEGSPAHGDK